MTAPMAGLVAVITGGASGIGAGAAAALSGNGARVAVLDLVETSAPRHAISVVCDVTLDESTEAAVETVARELGGIDVLVNNAGIGSIGTVEDHAIQEWHDVFDVNVFGTVRITRAALPQLRDSQHAAIVNTCSVVAEVGVPRRALYSASKGAVLALTRAMAADHVHEHVRVNAVVPGTTATPWVDRLLEASTNAAAERAALEQRQPLGRLVTAEEIANAIVYLASPISSATTGTTLTIDGGMTGLRLPCPGGPPPSPDGDGGTACPQRGRAAVGGEDTHG